MADPRLVDYIIDSLRNGCPSDYLVQILLNQGWDINEIREAINIAQGNPPAPPTSPSQQFQPQQAETGPAQQAEAKPQKPRRPAGIAIICLLGFLASVLMLLAGILIVFLGQILGQTIGSLPLGNEALPLLGNETGLMNMEEIGSFFGLSSGFLGMIFIALAIVDFAGFYLLWKMKRVGWILVTAVGIIMIIPYVLNFSINSLILIVPAAAIIVYLLIKRKLFA